MYENEKKQKNSLCCLKSMTYIQFLWQYKGTYGIINTRKKMNLVGLQFKEKNIQKKKIKIRNSTIQA